MTDLMEVKYGQVYSRLKIMISDAKFVSFTTDLWSNRKKKNSFLRFILKAIKAIV